MLKLKEGIALKYPFSINQDSTQEELKQAVKSAPKLLGTLILKQDEQIKIETSKAKNNRDSESGKESKKRLSKPAKRDKSESNSEDK